MSDRYNKIIFGEREEVIFLVGGYIRDIMAGRISRDRDYVVSGQLGKVLKRTAHVTGGKIVEVGKKGLYRIVIPDGATLDFSRLEGDISSNLLRRDFTINSMAWSPETGVIDTLGGIDDFSKGLIKMVRPENFLEDPVRIIRAYRFADEFSFRIERLTRDAMKHCKNKLKLAKSERITLEFFKILNSPTAPSILSAMNRDHILDSLIYCDYKELFSKIKVISIFYETIKKLPLKYKRNLNDEFSEDLLCRGLITLEIILKGGADSRLLLSSKIEERLKKYRLAEEIFLAGHRITNEVLFEMFEGTGESAKDFLISFNRIKFLDDYDRFLQIKEKRLLSGSEVREISGITGGPKLGKAIKMLWKAQFMREVTDRAQAEWFVRNISSFDI